MDVTVFSSPRGCRSYLIADLDTLDAALIDPTEEIDDDVYLDALAEHDLRLVYLIETHTHADHVSSTPRIAAKTGAKIVRHEAAPSHQKDVAVIGGESLPLGKAALEILATPGHTNESISIRIPGAVFTGDALLIGGTGRTDFQLGDSVALYHSLHETLARLPDETIVYPAHEYEGRKSSTIGTEKVENERMRLDQDTFIETVNAHHPPKPDLFDEAIARNSI